MTVNPFVKPAPGSPKQAKPPNELTHLVCCQTDPDTAMCGYAIVATDDEVTTGVVPPRDRCLVCDHFDTVGCPRCGR